MKRPRSLNGWSVSRKRRWLGALAASGLRLDVAAELLFNREAMKHWAGLARDCLGRFGPDMSPDERKRQDFADAAMLVIRMRVSDGTPFENLGLTIPTYNMCAYAHLFTVGQILDRVTMPETRLMSPARIEASCRELHNRLIAGGIDPSRLPVWLR